MSDHKRNFKRIAWTVEQVAAEFGPNPRTLAKRIKALGIQPDSVGKWTSKQVLEILTGSSLEQERIRKTRAEAEQIEKENAVADGDLVEVDDFLRAYETVYVEISRIIRESKLSETEQYALLEKLSEAHKTTVK